MKTAIIIPTRGRAKTLPFLRQNIKETTEVPYKIYFVIDHDDHETIEYLKGGDDYEVVINHDEVVRTPRNYNRGYAATKGEPYIAVLADDYLFHPGWLSTAIEKIADKGVLAFADKYSEGWGIFLIKREYIEKYSCVIDEPNKIFHEYRHEYADAELQFTARQRGQIVYSNIEIAHRNPKRLGSYVIDDKGNQLPQPQLLTFHHPAMSEYDIQSIVKKPDRIEVIVVPKNPILFDATYIKNSKREKIEADAQEFVDRAHMWGGQIKETIFKKDAV